MPGQYSLSTSLIDDASKLVPLRRDWDALAEKAEMPFAAPAWVEAWWTHLAPPRARLAVVAVHGAEGLVGLAPFYSVQRLGVAELRLLGGGMASRLGLLALPSRQGEVGAAVAEALCDFESPPDIILWEAIGAQSEWPELLSKAWLTGQHRILEESRKSAPVVRLEGLSYAEWMAAKSRNFRSQMRRKWKSIQERGVTARCADAISLSEDLDAFLALHTARWEDRGGSAAIPQGTAAMLQEAGASLVGSGRFRLWLLEDSNRVPISAQLFVAAGGTAAYWNGGFDEAWSEHSPGVLTLLTAIEDACQRGDRLLDLGGGEAAYKDRLANEDQPVAWYASYPRGRRYPIARLRRIPGQTARRFSPVLRRSLGVKRFNRIRGFFRG